MTLLIGVDLDIDDGMRRGCVDKNSANYDPTAHLDDGTCIAEYPPPDPCLVILERAWDECSGNNGDACSVACSTATNNATQGLSDALCANAVHESGQTLAQLLRDLDVAVRAVDCMGPATSPRSDGSDTDC